MLYRKSPDENFLLLITLKCGRNCKDCLYAELRGKQHMPLKMIEKAIAPHVTKFHHLDISGGEPAEHPQFWKIVGLLAGRNPTYLQVITNGISFSGSLKAAKEFASRLGKISQKSGTPISVRVSVDDFHAARLRGKEAEMVRRVKRIREAMESSPHLGLFFCSGTRKGQTKARLIRKYGLPKDRVISMPWKTGRQRKGGSFRRVLITPKGLVYRTERDMLQSSQPLGSLKKTKLPKILRRAHQR
jgi:organic radical activating enzyme